MNVLHSKSTKSNNRMWCVYSQFNKNGRVEAYVYDALNTIKNSGLEVIFVTTSRLDKTSDQDKLFEICNTVIVRENIGYDFGSYKVGIDHITKLKANPKKILITNDSVYGPFSNLNNFIRKSNSFDIYGLTDSIDFNYHLQSYFIIYNESVIKHKAFKTFWSSVKLLSNDVPDFKNKIIQDYEVGGSQYFIKHGFKIGAAYAFDKISEIIFKEFLEELKYKKNVHKSEIEKFLLGHNTTHNYWKVLLQLGFPYIKRELLTQNPTNSKIDDWPTIINELFEYDPLLIAESLYWQSGSNDFLYTSNEAKLIASCHIDSGLFKLNINSHLKNFQKKFKAKKTKLFKFDEEFYLSSSLDVKASIGEGVTKSGANHFIQYGHLERRRFRMTPYL